MKNNGFFRFTGNLDAAIIEDYSYLLPDSLTSASLNRRNEFITGRYCAIKAAASININIKEIGFSSKRAPMWPNDVVGSISHKNNQFVAIAALSKIYKSVGVDIEKIIDQKKENAIDRLVLTENDKLFLQNITNEIQILKTIIFSAKESLYKLIYPLVEVYFDFKEADFISMNFDSMIYEINLKSEKEVLNPFNGIYRGKVEMIDSDYIITSMLLTN